MNPQHLNLNPKLVLGNKQPQIKKVTKTSQAQKWAIQKRDSQSNKLCNQKASPRISNSRSSNIAKLPILEPYQTTKGQLTFDIIIHSRINLTQLTKRENNQPHPAIGKRSSNWAMSTQAIEQES